MLFAFMRHFFKLDPLSSPPSSESSPTSDSILSGISSSCADIFAEKAINAYPNTMIENIFKIDFLFFIFLPKIFLLILS